MTYNSAFYIPIGGNNFAGGKNQTNIFENFTNLTQSISLNGSVSSLPACLKNISEKISVQSASGFIEKYAIGALSELASGNKITGTKLADILFNTYAPALNLTALQLGYNSIENLILAVENGQIDCVTFFESLNSGLEIIADTSSKINYFSYGKEYPLDVVESFEKVLRINTPAHTYNQDESGYITGLSRIDIKLVAHIKNSASEVGTINNLAVFQEVMVNKQPITFRLGQDIYEFCIMTKFAPLVTNIYELKFLAELTYDLPNNSNSDETYISRILSKIVNGGVKFAKN